MATKTSAPDLAGMLGEWMPDGSLDNLGGMMEQMLRGLNGGGGAGGLRACRASARADRPDNRTSTATKRCKTRCVCCSSSAADVPDLRRDPRLRYAADDVCGVSHSATRWTTSAA
ncbi:MAG: hypothetical protein H6723_19395 [Sandaracinus sp.]|nr:hypothetical protein [Sandaracinus sp.]